METGGKIFKNLLAGPLCYMVLKCNVGVLFRATSLKIKNIEKK